MSGFVYAVECAGRVKLGFSEDPGKRFNKIASDAPFPCDLLGYWPASRADELALHAKFKKIRVHGEWFAVTEDLLSTISAKVIPMDKSQVRFRIGDDDTILAVWRKTQKQNAKVISKAMGINQSTWSRWERGTLRVPAERVPKLSMLTGIPRHELRPDIFPVERDTKGAAA
jgi:hypothetical protein